MDWITAKPPADGEVVLCLGPRGRRFTGYYNSRAAIWMSECGVKAAVIGWWPLPPVPYDLIKRCPEKKRRTSHIYPAVTLNGETKSLVEWADVYGINVQTVYTRLGNGWTVEDALMTPKMRSGSHSMRLLTINGETRTLSGWAEKYGVNQRTIYARLKRGWAPEEAVTTPPIKDEDKYKGHKAL